MLRAQLLRFHTTCYAFSAYKLIRPIYYTHPLSFAGKPALILFQPLAEKGEAEHQTRGTIGGRISGYPKKTEEKKSFRWRLGLRDAHE